MRNINFFLRMAAVAVFAAAMTGAASAQDTDDKPCPVCVALGTGATFGEIERIINSEFGTGRNPNTPTYYGGTPMHYAARHNRADVMDILESRGADVNTADDRDLTPFMVAVLSGSRKAALTLARMGAVAHSRDANGYTPMHAALMANRNAMVSIVADKIQEDKRPGYFLTPDSETVWHLAAAKITSAVLLAQMFDSVSSPTSPDDDFSDRSPGQQQIAAQNSRGTTPLMTAIHFGNLAAFTFIFDFLLSHNPAALETADDDGRTAYLMLQYWRHQSDAAQEMQDHFLEAHLRHGRSQDFIRIRSAVDNAGNDRFFYGSRGEIAGALEPPLSPSFINFQYQLPDAPP